MRIFLKYGNNTTSIARRNTAQGTDKRRQAENAADFGGTAGKRFLPGKEASASGDIAAFPDEGFFSSYCRSNEQ
jgi:hypothetical protein